MESISKSEKNSPSSILSIIAGALMIAGGILTISLFAYWTQGVPGFGAGMMGGDSGIMGGSGGMMGGAGGMMGGGFMWGLGLGALAISLSAGAVSIIGGYSIHKKPESSSRWGIAILISGIVGLIGLAGFIIGPILGIIGGTLALTRKKVR